jgi:hypothetical protein
MLALFRAFWSSATALFDLLKNLIACLRLAIILFHGLALGKHPASRAYLFELRQLHYILYGVMNVMATVTKVHYRWDLFMSILSPPSSISSAVRAHGSEVRFTDSLNCLRKVNFIASSIRKFDSDILSGSCPSPMQPCDIRLSPRSHQ